MLNRCAIVLRPKRPFLSWIDTVQRTMPKEYRTDVDDDQTVYLIPPSESWNSIDEVLESMYPQMFERELSESLNTQVNVLHGRTGKGRLVIHYSDLESLDGVLERLRNRQ